MGNRNNYLVGANQGGPEFSSFPASLYAIINLAFRPSSDAIQQGLRLV